MRNTHIQKRRRRKKSLKEHFQYFLGALREWLAEFFSIENILRSGQIGYVIIFFIMFMIIIYLITGGLQEVSNSHPSHSHFP